MKKALQNLYAQYHQLLEFQNFGELDYAIFEKHLPFLEQLDAMTQSAVSVFDLYQKKHIYISPHYQELMGISDESETDNKLHPQDLENSLRSGLYFMKIAFSLSMEKRKQYKFIQDYRIKNSQNEYVRVIEQHRTLELDSQGNVWLSLSIMDLSHEQDLETPYRCRLLNTKTGELFYLPNKIQFHSESELSEREKEILKYISKGLISKQIADKLYISVHTVNTHRQRIIGKLQVSNTFEAIQYAAALGLLA